MSSKNDPIPYLEDILNSIEYIEQYTKGIDLPEIENNQMIQDAIIRRIEIIGEVAGKLPENIKTSKPEIPWQDIKDMRNKLIHDYGHVDLELVWAVIENHLPTLKINIQEILDNLYTKGNNSQ